MTQRQRKDVTHDASPAEGRNARSIRCERTQPQPLLTLVTFTPCDVFSTFASSTITGRRRPPQPQSALFNNVIFQDTPSLATPPRPRPHWFNMRCVSAQVKWAKRRCWPLHSGCVVHDEQNQSVGDACDAVLNALCRDSAYDSFSVNHASTHSVASLFSAFKKAVDFFALEVMLASYVIRFFF